jgi:hypothetical protein
VLLETLGNLYDGLYGINPHIFALFTHSNPMLAWFTFDQEKLLSNERAWNLAPMAITENMNLYNPLTALEPNWIYSTLPTRKPVFSWDSRLGNGNENAEMSPLLSIKLHHNFSKNFAWIRIRKKTLNLSSLKKPYKWAMNHSKVKRGNCCNCIFHKSMKRLQLGRPNF